MKALVINQDSQTQRMAFQTVQLQTLGIEFQRIPAVALNGTGDPVYKKLHNTWQRPMTVGEVSCFLSHVDVWNIVLSRNEPMLVLEDDAWLDENIASLLTELNYQKNIDYVRLEVSRPKRKKLISKQPLITLTNSSLYRLYQGRSGSAGYVLWPNGAKKLLKQVAKGRTGIADKFINACPSLDTYQVEPAYIIQLDQCEFHGIKPPLKVQSTITTKTEPKYKPNLIEQIRYKTKRIVGEAKIGLTRFRHRYHADRRPVNLSNNFKSRSAK